MSLPLSSPQPEPRLQPRLTLEVVLALAVSLLLALLGLVAAPAGAAAPSAPVNASARPLSTTSIEVSWVRTETEDARYIIEESIANSWTVVRGTKKNLQKATFHGLVPGSLHIYRVSAKTAGGQSPPGNVTGAITDQTGPAGNCSPAAGQLCLESERFRILLHTRPSGLGSIVEGDGEAVRDDTAVLWPFGAASLDFMVRVVDACALNDRWWVFVAGWSNLEAAIDVIDTETGRTRSYYNPPGRMFQPLQDLSAFATCPS